jgi:RNA polymerase sigma factor (sigma-70 family)
MTANDRSGWVRAALERFERPLVAYATSLLRDAHAARDAVQDTFLRLVRADRASVEPVLAAWLFTVCRRRAVDRMRRGKVAARTNAEGLDGSTARNGAAHPPDEEAAVHDEAEHVLDAIARLSPGHQEVLRLRLSHGLSYADIAQVTGLSTTHVGVKLHEGMKALRARLGTPSPSLARGGSR